MKLLREKPYVVQKTGPRGVKMRLHPTLRESGMFKTGDYLHLQTDKKGRLKLSLFWRSEPPNAMAEVIRHSGSFWGIHVPRAAQKLFGLVPGVKYRLYVDEKYIIVQKAR